MEDTTSMMFRCPHCGKLIEVCSHTGEKAKCPNCGIETAPPAGPRGASGGQRPGRVRSGTATTRRRWVRRLAPVAGFLAALAVLAIVCAAVACRPAPSAVKARGDDQNDRGTKPFEPSPSERYNNHSD